MKHHLLPAILCLFSWLATELHAEENAVSVASLVVGDTVRFRTKAMDAARASRLRAVVVEVNDTSLLVETGSKGGSQAEKEGLRVPLTDFTSLEVARGKRSQAGKGAKVGALIGGVGMVLAVGADGGFSGDCEGLCGLLFAAGGLGGAAAGAIVGAVAGSGFKTERFKRVSVKTVHVSLQPVRGGLAASLMVRF